MKADLINAVLKAIEKNRKYEILHGFHSPA